MFGLFEVVMDAILRIEQDSHASDGVKELRKDALGRALAIYMEFDKQGFLPDFVKTAFEKKVQFILGASTRGEMDEVLKMSVPYYNYSEIVPKSPYHIEEEELLLWFGIAPACKLSDEANKRISLLFEKFFPAEYARICSVGA